MDVRLLGCRSCLHAQGHLRRGCAGEGQAAPLYHTTPHTAPCCSTLTELALNGQTWPVRSAETASRAEEQGGCLLLATALSLGCCLPAWGCLPGLNAHACSLPAAYTYRDAADILGRTRSLQRAQNLVSAHGWMDARAEREAALQALRLRPAMPAPDMPAAGGLRVFTSPLMPACTAHHCCPPACRCRSLYGNKFGGTLPASWGAAAAWPELQKL